MKKIIVVLALLCIVLHSFSKTNKNVNLSKDDYLLKSKKQKKVGWILLASGIGLMATAFIIPRGELVRDGICIGILCDDKYKNDDLKSAVFIAGGAAALGSIPFFVISSKNKKRVASASAFFRMERAPVLQWIRLGMQSYPAEAVSIHLP
ncbi:MAG: hypothetical protein ICV53_20760 [Flavisolibacter sp.]|nr:hypothetical protein [Flavisolibacter sp.]